MRKVLQKICVVLIIIVFLVGISIHIYTKNITNKIANVYAEIEYENMVSYEACTVSVDSLLQLYSLSNDDEKEKLAQRNTIQQDVIDQWCSTHTLDEVTKTVELIELRYATPVKEPLMNIKSTYKYLALLQVESAGISEIHYVYYEYCDKKITVINEFV